MDAFRHIVSFMDGAAIPYAVAATSPLMRVASEERNHVPQKSGRRCPYPRALQLQLRYNSSGDARLQLNITTCRVPLESVAHASWWLLGSCAPPLVLSCSHPSLVHLELNALLLNMVEFRASGCAHLATIKPLEQCHYLQVVDVSRCGRLRDLSPLRASAAVLKELSFSYTAVTSLASLRVLHALETVAMSWCSEIVDFSPLLSLPHLRTLNAANSALDATGVLRNCPYLEKIDLSWSQVEVLRSFSCAGYLKVLFVSYTNIDSIEALRDCELLECLFLHKCVLLTDLSPLEELSTLKVLDISDTAVEKLDSLRLCNSLEVLFMALTQVADLAPLAGAQSLKVLDASYTQVNEVSALKKCTSLEKLYLKGCCSGTIDLAPVTALPQLVALETKDSSVVNKPFKYGEA